MQCISLRWWPFGVSAKVVGPLTTVLVGLCMSVQAHAQQTKQLECQGILGNTPAQLSGVRQFQPSNALGDGYVKFSGSVTAGGIQGRIAYEGYSRTARFSGILQSAAGAAEVGVLDSTGGAGNQMIIYGGKPSLGPPNTIGQFVCSWR